MFLPVASGGEVDSTISPDGVPSSRKEPVDRMEFKGEKGCTVAAAATVEPGALRAS